MIVRKISTDWRWFELPGFVPEYTATSPREAFEKHDSSKPHRIIIDGPNVFVVRWLNDAGKSIGHSEYRAAGECH